MKGGNAETPRIDYFGMARRRIVKLPAASAPAGATMEVTVARRTSALGSLYKGREGQWSWIAHRVTGVGILLFLFAHIIDTALVGWGPEAYNRVISVYHHPIVQIM